MGRFSAHLEGDDKLRAKFNSEKGVRWCEILTRDDEITLFFRNEAQLVDFKNKILQAYEQYKRRNKEE